MSNPARTTTVLECLPFVVDTWNTCGNAALKPHFLTHCHKDHTDGIDACSLDVFCTHLTRRLLLLRQPAAGHGNRFHTLELGVPVELTHESVTFTVTALDANHCPGSVMLLFQGCFGNILHTGDCRWSPKIVRAVQEALRGDCECDYEPPPTRGSVAGGQSWGCGCSCGAAERLDLLYLDCTFANLPLEFPSREEAVRHAEQLIRLQAGGGGGGGGVARGGAPPPLRRVFLSSDLLGTEPLLAMAGEVFGQPLYVCPPELHKEYGFANPDLVRQRRDELEVLLPNLRLSEDPGCLFHLCGVRDFAHRGRQTRLMPPHRHPHQHPLRQSCTASYDDVRGSLGGGVGAGGDDAAWLPSDSSAGDREPSGAFDGGCLYIRASTQVFGKHLREQYDSNPNQLLAVRSALPAPTSAVIERAVHYVLYSVHSSRSELVAALCVLQPRATRPIASDQAGCMAAVVSERAGSERTVDVEREISGQMAWATAASVSRPLAPSLPPPPPPAAAWLEDPTRGTATRQHAQRMAPEEGEEEEEEQGNGRFGARVEVWKDSQPTPDRGIMLPAGPSPPLESSAQPPPPLLLLQPQPHGPLQPPPPPPSQRRIQRPGHGCGLPPAPSCIHAGYRLDAAMDAEMCITTNTTVASVAVATCTGRSFAAGGPQRRGAHLRRLPHTATLSGVLGNPRCADGDAGGVRRQPAWSTRPYRTRTAVLRGLECLGGTRSVPTGSHRGVVGAQVCASAPLLPPPPPPSSVLPSSLPPRHPDGVSGPGSSPSDGRAAASGVAVAPAAVAATAGAARTTLPAAPKCVQSPKRSFAATTSHAAQTSADQASPSHTLLSGGTALSSLRPPSLADRPKEPLRPAPPPSQRPLGPSVSRLPDSSCACGSFGWGYLQAARCGGENRPCCCCGRPQQECYSPGSGVSGGGGGCCYSRINGIHQHMMEGGAGSGRASGVVRGVSAPSDRGTTDGDGMPLPVRSGTGPVGGPARSGAAGGCGGAAATTVVGAVAASGGAMPRDPPGTAGWHCGVEPGLGLGLGQSQGQGHLSAAAKAVAARPLGFLAALLAQDGSSDDDDGV